MLHSVSGIWFIANLMNVFNPIDLLIGRETLLRLHYIRIHTIAKSASHCLRFLLFLSRRESLWSG